MRIALVHDYLSQDGGAERVLKAFHELWPEAPIFVLFHDPKKITGFKEIARARELWLDFFIGENQYHQTDQQWQKYIYAFTIKAQLEK